MKSLEESGEALSVLYRHLLCPVLIISPKLKILEINQPALDFYAWEKEEVFHQHYGRICRRYGYFCPFLKEVDAILAGELIEAIEVTIKPRKYEKTVAWHACRFFDSDGAVAGFILLGKDLTQLRQAEEQAAQLDSIVAQIPGYVYWQTRNSVYLGCNQMTADFFGMTREEIVGHNAYDLLQDYDRSESDKDMLRDDEEVYSTGIPKRNIVYQPYRDQSGKIREFLTSKIPLFDKRGNVCGLLGISIDISDRRQMERELEAANHAKSDFIANMSHDFRTPITGMMGLVESIHGRASDTQTKDESKLLMACNSELLRLLNEVLEVVKIESGEQKDVKVAFDLQDTIDHHVTLMKPALIDKGLHLDVNYQSDIYCFVGMQRFLGRILLNLLANAVKFTEKGTVGISVFTTRKEEDQCELEIRISDTGIGIPDDKREFIFEHFSRLTPSYKGTYKGYGLGLYTVKNYVGAMGGTIEVESELGKGSTFIVKLPLAEAPGDACVVTAEKQFSLGEASIDPVTFHGGGAYSKASKKKDTKKKGTSAHVASKATTSKDNTATRILIVEDNPLAAKMAAAKFESLHCVVDVAETGEEGVNRVKENHYHAIMMDIGLPDTDGLTVTRQIRTLDDQTRSAIPIIALSGHVGESHKAGCIEAGMNGVTSKPLSDEEAQFVLSKFVNKPVEKSEQKKTKAALNKNIFEWERAVKLAGSESLAKEVLGIFTDELPESKASIADGYESGDKEKFYAAVHKFYGGVCYCGMPRLTEATEKLKCALREGKGTKAEIAAFYKVMCKEIKAVEGITLQQTA